MLVVPPRQPANKTVEQAIIVKILYLFLTLHALLQCLALKLCLSQRLSCPLRAPTLKVGHPHQSHHQSYCDPGEDRCDARLEHG